MRILHIGNTANQGWALAQGAKALGHHAVTMGTIRTDWIQYPEDTNLHTVAGDGTSMSRYERLAEFIDEFDVIHSHSGFTPLLATNKVAAVQKACRDKVLIRHFHGTGLRTGRGAMPWFRKPDLELVSTPDLLRWLPRATFVPNSVWLPEGLPSKTTNGSVRFLHSPTNPTIKGSDAIARAAVAAGIDLSLTGGLPWASNLLNMLKYDVLVDQFITRDSVDEKGDPAPVGQFGVSSLEAMALGLVAVSHLSEETRAAYGNPPILSALTEEGLSGLMLDITQDAVAQVGEEGKRYVERHHSSARLAKRILSEAT